MEVTAQSKYIRISPRKVRLVVEAVKNLPPYEALENLRYMSKKAAMPLRKLLTSAIASAKNNYGLNDQTLRIKSLVVDEGPTYKRWRPVSRGRTHPIMKRTSHLKVILEGEK
jgi:large subunit ribosomal protein L22